MRMRLTLLACVGSVLLLAVSAGPAGAWRSNWFVSPTHNIHCRYWPATGLMACTTQNDDFMVGVKAYGDAWYRHTTAGYTFPTGPTLEYGDTWTATVDGRNTIRCWSRSTGMTCKSLLTGRGFFIERATYRLF